MTAVRGALAFVVLLLLNSAALCSQICDFNCAFYGCSLSSPVKASEDSSEHASCHHHKKQIPTPQKRNDSHHCPGHFDAAAVLSSPTISGHTLCRAFYAPALVAAQLLTLKPSRDTVAIQSDLKPDRSPPINSVLRI